MVCMSTRYRRRLRLMIGAAIIVPLLLTGGATADPVHSPPKAEPIYWTNPAARAPGGTGVTPKVTKLSLGAFDGPAPGVSLEASSPADNPEEKTSGPKPLTLNIVRASTAPFSAVGVTWKETD